jgi:hypothetical protein
VKNGGKTPAIKVRGSFDTGFVRTDDVASSIPKDCEKNCSVGMLMPESTYKWKNLTIATDDVKKAATYKDGAFFVLGRIDYEDAENHYWTIMCWYYDPQLSALSPWSGYNNVGSEKKLPAPNVSRRSRKGIN